MPRRSHSSSARTATKSPRSADHGRGAAGAGSGEGMNPSILDDPKHWRRRAAAARLVAGQLDGPVAKAAMLRIAEDYERIAEHARVRTNGAGDDRQEPDHDLRPERRQHLCHRVQDRRRATFVPYQADA